MTEKVVINCITKKKDVGYVPVLVNFQHGTFQENYLTQSSFFLAKKTGSTNSEGIFSIKKNLYRGRIRENEDEPVNIYLAVKRGQKINFIEVDQCTLVNNVHSQETHLVKNITNKELALKVLMKNFGGSKAKISYERRERSKVNLDVIKNQLNKTVDDAWIGEDEITNFDQIDVVPPFNENATDISDIYNLTNILSETFLKSLNQEAVAVDNFKTTQLPITSDFIKSEIERVKNIQDKQTRHTSLKVLIYLDGLLNYIKLRKKNIEGVELSKISDRISTDICFRFSPKESRRPIQTMTSVDKAICYFIVLIILIQPNFELDINILTTELSRQKKKIMLSCNMVHVRNKRFSDVVTFVLPSSNPNSTKKNYLKRKTM